MLEIALAVGLPILGAPFAIGMASPKRFKRISSVFHAAGMMSIVLISGAIFGVVVSQVRAVQYIRPLVPEDVLIGLREQSDLDVTRLLMVLPAIIVYLLALILFDIRVVQPILEDERKEADR